MGVSYYAVATSLLGLVGDSLFDDRQRQERISADQLAAEMEPLLAASRMEELTRRLTEAGGELGARLMVLDHSGKVQADTYAQLNGSRLTIPEVVGILATGKTADYGVHMIEEGSSRNFWHFWQPYNEDAEWISYCTAGLYHRGALIGVLVLSSPIAILLRTDMTGVTWVTILISLVTLALGFVAAMLLARGSAEEPAAVTAQETDGQPEV